MTKPYERTEEKVSDEAWGSNIRAGLDAIINEQRLRVLSQFSTDQLRQELERRDREGKLVTVNPA